MHRDDSIRRQIDRLGQLLATEDGAQVLAHMQKLALRTRRVPAPVEAGTSHPRERGPGARLGVWLPDGETPGRWARDPHVKNDWRRWADVPAIAPKANRPRVLLLGESTARGYLYDPVVTPARLLERELARDDSRSPQVVDLARIGMPLSELPDLVSGLERLEPDAVVLFAGNNWANADYTVADLDRLAGVLSEGGYPAVHRAFWELVLRPRVQAFLGHFARTVGRLGIPGVVIVPEFNLRSWRPEPSVLAPILAQGRNRAWRQAHRAARAAAHRGDWHAGLEQAMAMRELDEGTSAMAPWLAGEACVALGWHEEARSWFEAARDDTCGLFLAHTPRCPGPVQEMMRETGARLGLRVVDLPALFRRAAPEGIPGRELFLDYCHLTLEGHGLAARAAAEEVLAAWDRPILARRPLTVELDPADEARAHVLAAIHNAHYGQARETLDHHCRTALKLAPSAGGELAAFLDFEARRAPAWMCGSYARFCEAPAVERYLAATVPRMVDKLADFSLRAAMAEALDDGGLPGAREGEAVLEDEHGTGPVDLLAYRWRCTTFRERTGYARSPEKAYVQSFDDRARHFLVRRVPEDLRLRITCRVPGGDVTEPVRVLVNGHLAGEVAALGRWLTADLKVPASAVRSGVNHVDVLWPDSTPPWRTEIERAVSRLDRGEAPDVLAVAGELHQLRALPGGGADG